jgi:hypothetical protein
MHATLRESGTDDRFFLGVRESVRGMAWRHRLTGRQEAVALAIAQGHGVPEIVARVLAGRGVTAEQAAPFLDPTIRDLLPDPALLTDMSKAAARIADAIERRERFEQRLVLGLPRTAKQPEAFLGEREEDVVLAGEVAVDGGGAVLDALGNLANRDVPVAFGREQLPRGIENRAADRFAIPLLTFLNPHRRGV